MIKGGAVWECGCGHVDYGEFPPQECPKCWKANSFVEVPEDMIDKIKDHVLENIRKEVSDDEDLEEDEELE